MNVNRGMKAFLIVLALLLVSFSTGAFGQAVSDEAKRHFDRGMAAVEMAKSPDDYAPAIKEFKQAASLAPNWPDAYYNLGKAPNERLGFPQQYLCATPSFPVTRIWPSC